jgi:hypothetical protein
MGIVGNSTIEAGSVTVTTGRVYWLPAGDYTPGVNEDAATAFIYLQSAVGSAGTVQLGVYRVSDSVLMGVTNVSFPANAALGWYSAAMPGGVVLSAGVAYRAALADPTQNVTLYFGSATSAFGDFRTTLPDPFAVLGTQARNFSAYVETAAAAPLGPDYTQRKNSSFNVTHGLGTITTATLNAAAITINTTGAGTVNLTDTSGIATSGEYNLVLGDGAATETYTVQLNVIGLPAYTLNKDGAALGALTGIKAVVTATAELNGTELYSANNLTATAGVMDSGIYPDTGAVADVVTVSILTSSGDGITFSDALEQF